MPADAAAPGPVVVEGLPGVVPDGQGPADVGLGPLAAGAGHHEQDGTGKL